MTALALIWREMKAAEKLVIEVLNEVLVENGGHPFPFVPDTRILAESGMDSLGLALTLVKLEECTGKDPFAGGFISFVTVAELSRLYEQD